MRTLLLALAAVSLFAADEPGFTPLFDGKSLTGWKLVNGKGNLFTDKEYGNFVLRFEFLLTAGANSGVGIRAPLEGDAAYKGMELQILDDGDPVYKGVIRPEQYHGSVYGVFPARTGFRKPVGQWNEEEIAANGRRITVKLNGVTILDADLDLVKEAKVLQEHPGLANKTGHIGFLGHGTHVEFRNIRLKELK